MKQKSAVIGSGVAGLGAAIRLASKGYLVEVFEQAPIPGGKISQISLAGFRFDTGPSLFTMPELVDELFALCGENPADHFEYYPVETSCKYFWEDGLIINAWQNTERFAKEVEDKTGVPASRIRGFLDKSKRLYELTGEIFLFNSFHKLSNYFNPAYFKTLLNLPSLDAQTTMHKKNLKWFDDPRIVQLFDRYATYNGSSPYRTPATLNIIAHLEHNNGTFFPKKGMYDIVQSLYELAKRAGVVFHFNQPVDEIILEGKQVKGLRTGNKEHHFDLVVSDVDVVNLYKKLLPKIPLPKKQLALERSSSALIYYWGVDHTFPELQLHNILFSDNYREEFDHLFKTKTVSDDPTVYLFISSKAVEGDAPKGCENWYVMINAPRNEGQDWEVLNRKIRKDIIKKINRVLNTDIEKHIVAETVADPRSIEENTGSFKGSLYGLSSNGKFAAFNRHPNFKRNLKNLYFAGGSVHPGGGIPLCLASAKIIDKEIPNIITK